MHKKLTIFFLGLILLVAFLLRINKLDTIPPELHPDELVNIVSAKNSIETGYDIQGKQLFYFSDRVELRPPLYGYVTYFFTRFLGEGAFGIRFAAVVFSMCAIVTFFLTSLMLFKEKYVALFTALFVTIMPWNFHYARIGWEPASFLSLFSLGILALYKGVEEKKERYLFLGMIFFGLSFYSYHTAILYAAVTLVGFVVTHRSFFLKQKHVVLKMIILALIMVLPFLYTAFTQDQLLDRAKRISTFKEGVSTQTLTVFFSNYAWHFSPQFLFLTGDQNLRHNSGFGELPVASMIIIPIGIWALFKGKSPLKKPVRSFLLWGLIFYPLGGSLTNDGVPHATRTLVGSYFFTLIATLGFVVVVHGVSKAHKIVKFGVPLFLSALVCICQVPYFIDYFTQYPIRSESWWQYGHKQVFESVKGMSGYTRACLGNLDYWGNPQLIYYYLPQTSLQIIDTTDDALCESDQTILVLPYDGSHLENVTLFKEVNSLSGQPLYSIYTKP